MDIAELFGQQSSKKHSKSVDIANFLRILASLLAEEEETGASVKSENVEEVQTRPHFTPSGG